jgi:EamA-like transporter family
MSALVFMILQALYYILAKHLVGKYNPVCIAAWAYMVAASLMGATAAATVQRNEWIVPTAMLGPLIYWYGGVHFHMYNARHVPTIWASLDRRAFHDIAQNSLCCLCCRICIASILGYYLLTWATSVLPASQVASFQALQPLMGTVLSFLFLGERPTAWDLGGIGVISGLILVVHDAKDSVKQREVSLPHLSTRSKLHHQRHI